MEKLIIEARINEYAMREENPHVPWTAAEIAEDAVACREAGASIVHFHAREAEGRPAHDAATYADGIRRIKARSDILTHPTLGFVTLDAPPETRVGHVVEMARNPETRPDFAPMDTGSTNIDRYQAAEKRFRTTDLVYRNSTATLQHFAAEIAAAGVKHYLVSWNIGFTRQALALIETGAVPTPAFLLFVLTDGEVLAGHPGTPEGLRAHLDMLPAPDGGLHWAACDFGGDLLAVTPMIIERGGHVSIGLGDHAYVEAGTPTTADLVAKVADMARAAGREVAAPADVKEMLAMG